MDVTNFITSGSYDAEDPLQWEGITTPPIGGILMMPGGDVKLLLGDPKDMPSDMNVEEWVQINTCLSYLMYALEKKDWMLEYMTYEKQLEDMITEGFKDMERNRVRSRLRVIEGGKSDSKTEDDHEADHESE